MVDESWSGGEVKKNTGDGADSRLEISWPFEVMVTVSVYESDRAKITVWMGLTTNWLADWLEGVASGVIVGKGEGETDSTRPRTRGSDCEIRVALRV